MVAFRNLLRQGSNTLFPLSLICLSVAGYVRPFSEAPWLFGRAKGATRTKASIPCRYSTVTDFARLRG